MESSNVIEINKNQSIFKRHLGRREALNRENVHKMKIVLVNPPAPTAEVSKYLKIITPPMGLAYLAAVLEKDGHSVRIVDAVAEPISPSQLRTQLEQEDPNIIGATATTPTIFTAMAVIRIGKESCPDAFTSIARRLMEIAPEPRRSPVQPR